MMTDMKKIVLTLLMLATALQAGAVLKENIYSEFNENGIEIPSRRPMSIFVSLHRFPTPSDAWIRRSAD